MNVSIYYKNGKEMFDKRKKEVISLDIFTFDCNGCQRCVQRCHRNVLMMVDNGYCRYAIVGKPDNCDGCGKCIGVCKRHAMRLITQEYSY